MGGMCCVIFKVAPEGNTVIHHILKKLRNVDTGSVLFLMAILVSLALPETAFAEDGMGEGGGLPYESGLKNLALSMTGPVPFVISLLGIVGCGAMLIFGGEISGFMRTMVFIVLVVAVIVQAENIVNLLKGTGGSSPGDRSGAVSLSAPEGAIA
jgi:type IV secretion system protein TrbC